MDVAHKLDCEWPHLASGRVAEVFPRWRRQQPQLRRFRSPHNLLAFLHSAPAEQTDGPLLALLTLARTDRLAGRTLLQWLLPALKTRADRIAFPCQRRDEVWEALLYSGWEVICCYPLERRRARVAANLVLDVLHHTTQELHHHRRYSHAIDEDRRGWLFSTKPGRDGEASALDRQPSEPVAPARQVPVEAVVLEGVAAGVIVERDADLILRTRVDGIRLRLIARTLGVSYEALLKRRQRAEAALRSLLARQSDVRKASLFAPVSTAGPIPLPHRTRADSTFRLDADAGRAA